MREVNADMKKSIMRTDWAGLEKKATKATSILVAVQPKFQKSASVMSGNKRR